MSRELKLSSWLVLAGSASMAVAILLALALHERYSVHSADLVLGCVVYTAIETATFGALFWARKRFQPVNDPRPTILITCINGLVLGLLGMFYAAHWNIVSWVSIRGDLIGFPIFVFCGTIVMLAIYSVRRRRSRNYQD